MQEAGVPDSISASDLGKVLPILGLPFFVCKIRRLGELVAKCLFQRIVCVCGESVTC